MVSHVASLPISPIPLIRRIRIYDRRRRSHLFAAVFVAAVAAFAAIGYALLSSGERDGQALEWIPYQWPIKPFNRHHPIRGNLDDPRMPNRHINGPGPFSFHSGVDVSAPGGTAVYTVAPGHVCTLGAGSRGRPTAVGVCGEGFEFEYSHIRPIVESGQRLAKHQLLGYVIKKWGHVHLSEMWDGRTWNPLRVGGLTPYDDHTKPTIVSVMLYRNGSFIPLPTTLSGRVDLVLDAYDTPELSSNWPWAIVTPALIRWRLLSEATGKVVIPTRTSFDFRLNKPKTAFTEVFAPGTRQNGAKRAGVYDFWLVRSLDSSLLPNGAYRLVVLASDTRANTAKRSFRLTLSN